MIFWDRKRQIFLQWTKQALYCAAYLSSLSQCLGETTLNWSGESFFVMTKGMKVSRILEDLGANYGVPVIVSSKIDEIFVGTLKDKTPEEILENLSSIYHLIWYFDGRSLYVCKASEIAQVVLMPNYLTLEMLQEYMGSTDVLDPRSWSIKKVPGFNAFELIGPPAFIARIQKLVSELDDHAVNLEQNKETIEIFPLKYAQAGDQTYQYQGNTVTLPGVVTLLGQMIGMNENQSNVKGEFGEKTGLPMISADPRKNAVVIRDMALNLAMYKNLIEELDQVQEQVEISVTIIDIDAENTEELGLNFSATLETPNLNGGLGFDGGATQSKNMVSIDSGLGFSSKIKDCLQFDATLRALQTQARARVVAQPSIITLNNMKAILDKSVTFYTPMKFGKEAKLETISSGTLLEVTPSLSLEASNPQVRLQIHLKDGKLENNSDESALPQVQDSEIVTQAILNTGEGLLLGGFVREENKYTKKNVPWIGNLPLIGSLFSSNVDSKAKLVRLFFIKASAVTTLLPQPEVQNPASIDTPNSAAKTEISGSYNEALSRVQQEAELLGWANHSERAQKHNSSSGGESRLNSEEDQEYFDEDFDEEEEY